MNTVVVLDERRCYLALSVVCVGVLMNSLNSTIVSVALPTIGAELGFSSNSLAWVVNAYLVAYGSCLLLAGRLGDLFGHRNMLGAGAALFATSSLACGLAHTPGLLIGARALQGVGGAMISAIGLSLIAKIFLAVDKRAMALGAYALVSASGSSAGMLLGGVMTSELNWQWTFLVHVPVGIGLCMCCLMVLPTDSRTMSNGPRELIPLCLFRKYSLLLAACAGALLSTVALTWTFFSALYLQRLLHWSALQTGLIFVPANVATAIASFALTPRMIARFGIGPPLFHGFALAAVGLLMLDARLTATAEPVDVLPGMLLIGLGIGLTYSPTILGALRDTATAQAGTVSGIINTAFAVGGAIGLAVLVSIATARSDELLSVGATLPVALEAGYQRAFHSGAMLAATGCLIGAMLLKSKHRATASRN